MGDFIAFKGSVQPAIWLTFQTDVVAGAHSTATPAVGTTDYIFPVENEALFEFTLRADTGSGIFTVHRKATKKHRLFNAALNTYLSEPVPSDALNDIFTAADAGTLKLFLTVKIWFKPFFEQVVKSLTRTDADTFNFARPDAASQTDIEGSYTHKRSGSKAKITHPDVQKEIKDIPCELTGRKVIPRKGKAPTVKMFLYMRIKEDLAAADRDNASRIFLAADWSKVYRFATNSRSHKWHRDPGTPPKGTERSIKKWELNIMNYLWKHSSLDRGNLIAKEIIDNAEANIALTQVELAQQIRDDIDARMVTSNHWGDAREDWTKEQYQRKLSDVFGAIHQTQWEASPVFYLRSAQTLLGLAAGTPNLLEKIQLTLQWGLGHCGEHSHVSFGMLVALVEKGHSAKFGTIILTGNANIDHAFVVGGIRVDEVIQTLRTRPFPSAKDPDEPVGTLVSLWDVRATLAANPGEDGYVVDPYLAPVPGHSEFQGTARTAKDLLAAMNGSIRKKQGKNTDFLAFRLQHPAAPAAVETFVTKVKHV